MGPVTALKRRAAALLTTVIVVGAVGAAIPAVVSAAPIDVTPSDGLDFGDVPVGEVSAPLGFTFQATGEDPGPVFIGVEISQVDGGPFGITSNDCPELGLMPGNTCTVTLEFHPLVQGPRSATLVVNGQTSQSLFRSLRGSGVGVASPVAWPAGAHAGPAYTWNGGGALARTVQSGSQRLHLAYATNRIGGKWASDSGKHAGIYYIRSATGSTWSAPKRLNPSTQHAARLGLAAAGSRVYVTGVSQTKFVKYSPSAPRALYVRVNSAHGAATTWKSTIRLTSASGRVDYPTIAAAGNDAFVAWADSNSGKVKVAASHDRGRTWKTAGLGSTSAADSSGRLGLPSVSADGATVVVAWVANAAGTIKARVSVDHGKTWGSVVVVSPSAVGSPSTAVRGDRIAVTWSFGQSVAVRQRVAGTWLPAAEAVSLESQGDSGVSLQDVTGPPPVYAPAVALQDSGRIALTWAQVTTGGRWDLEWAESADGGASWFEAQTIGSSASSATRFNDWASVIWPTAGTRYVAWNGWTPNTNNYRLYLRTGNGAPSGATGASLPLTPSPAGVPSTVTGRDHGRGPR